MLLPGRQASTMSKKSLKEVHEYVWRKYIDVDSDEPAPVDLDDATALGLLEESFSRVDINRNKDFYTYGVLLFEMAYLDEECQLPYFIRAKRILEKYRQITGEKDWEEINDRIDDINQFLDNAGLLHTVEAAGDVLLDPTLDIAGYLEQHRLFPKVPDGMVLVSGGEYIAGTERERRTVDPFLIDVHPVTNAQYQHFLEDTGYRPPRFWEDARFNQPNQPVVGVSLSDAKKYAKWAEKDLPTEAQWEKAARGLDGRTYPWGDALHGKGTVYDLDPEVAAALPINSAPDLATPFGCLEMAGFVWEWTKSLYEKGGKNRVLKGGSWADDERFIACAFRLPVAEREKADNVGFRCCVNPS